MYGMGLRHQHFEEVLSRLEGEPSSLGVDYFEIITENFLDTKGRPFGVLRRIREKFPISFHGVSLSIAGDEELDLNYLNKILLLEKEIEPFLVSDHLCWTGTAEKKLHNLLPFPYTNAEINRIAERVLKVQEVLKRPMVFENLSAYIQFVDSDISEAEFFLELHNKTDCEILLDINNLYVNVHNFNVELNEWYDLIPVKAVREIHLAGFTDMGEYFFDTHSKPVHEDVWGHFSKFKKKFTNAVTTIEWDEEIPPYDVVLEEVRKARSFGE